MTKATWRTVPDSAVRHIWQCEDEECDESDCVEIAPDWYQANGTPVCGGCDRDMTYIRTEIRTPNDQAQLQSEAE